VASSCYHKAHYAASRIGALPGFEVLSRGFFHEFVVRCPRPTSQVSEALLAEGIIPGFELGQYYPELGDSMLFCVTELNTRGQIDRLVDALGALS